MTIEITWGTLSAAAAVATAVVKVVHWLVASALEKRDDKIKALSDELKALKGGVQHELAAQVTAHANDISNLRATIKALFERIDEASKDHQAYKLYVAETYVNRGALKELLLPIERRLDNIENDIRRDGKR